MDIFKAIKKERKFLKKFYIMMILIAIILPFIVLLTGLATPFYLSYLMFIEFLIVVAIINKANYHKITYVCNNNRLRFKCGLWGKESLIFCDKVVLVHTEKMEEEMEIIIVTSVNFKNKMLKPVLKGFLKKYPLITEEFLRIKELQPENVYYYQVVKRGGLNKYMLLDNVYKNCVKATYTEECIQNIKIARGQTLV
ncbi:hypothetical protein ACQPU1_05065 [Clostridium paraputrificum]|uniref:hypothetical protein n=1 Tax=Clostridium TaxID=1485 RepID=UPI003D34E151